MQNLVAIDTTKSDCGINCTGLPSSILKNMLRGHVFYSIQPEPPLYLSNKEEKELAIVLKDSASVGYGKTQMVNAK